MVQPQYADDEIDLFELWNNLWEQKLQIIIITLIVTFLGASYALFATPTYQATSYFLPPQKQDVKLINLDLSTVFDDSGEASAGHKLKDIVYTTDAVFQRFVTNLQSRSIRLSFFNEKGLLDFYTQGKDYDSVYEVFDEEFNQKLILVLPKKNQNNEFVSLTLDLSEAELSAELLNEFIDDVRTKTKQEILAEVKFELTNQVKALEEQLAAKRELAEQRRMDRIKELLEALSVAKAMGLSAPKIDQAANKLNMEYMRGTKSIEAEIKVLTNRESDDPFIPGLRDNQEKIAYLKSIQIDPELVNVVRLDQEAEVPVKPIKPKKMLIVAVAIVLGGMLGVFVALIRSAIRNRKQRLEQASAQ